MSGESFQVSSTGNNNSVNCNSNGAGTFTYTATGTATGPYSGSFTETGTVNVDSSGNATATASFTITSPQGAVTGRETLVPPPDFASCQQGGGSVLLGNSTYQATIATPNGTYADQGTTRKLLGLVSSNTSLNEEFTSSQTTTTLIAPTNKDQCKDDGWKNYPQFKNQGQCVSFVNHE